MKISRFTEEQIIEAIRSQVSGEKTVEKVCRELGISAATFFKWKQKYVGMTISEAKRLRALESENTLLKKLLSERTLEIDALQDVLHAAVTRRLTGVDTRMCKCESFNGRLRDVSIVQLGYPNRLSHNYCLGRARSRSFEIFIISTVCEAVKQ
jgi:putative transposase